MAQTAPAAEWTQTDAVNLRTYLAANPKFLTILMDVHRPRVEGNTMEARAVTGSDLNGFLLAIDAIKAMQGDPIGGEGGADFIEASNQE